MLFLLAYALVFGTSLLLAFRLFSLSGSVQTSTCHSNGTLFHALDNKVTVGGRTRGASSVVTDGPQAEMLRFLGETCCTLPARGKDLRVLAGPKQFFSELLRQISAAQHRIVLSALYIGDGPLARQLVTALRNRVSKARSDKKALDVCILLDYNRMHVRQNLKTVAELLNLQSEAASPGADSAVNVRLFLFQSPCRWNWLVAPFGRAREALGVQHTKIFCFDNCQTILTGANLSDDYFDTRVDRYLAVHDNPHVAAWFSGLVDALCALSYPVGIHKECNTNAGSATVAGCGDTKKWGQNANSSSGEFVVHAGSNLTIFPNMAGVDPSTQWYEFCEVAERRLRDFAHSSGAVAAEAWQVEQHPEMEDEATGHYDTLLFPTMQCARANIFHDSFIVQMLLRMAPRSTHIYLASPYLNMYGHFVDELLASSSPYDFITASVSTNGWYGSKGFARYIPYFYLQLQRAFRYLMKEYKCAHRIRLHEFSAEGKTYHAKGLWFMKDQKQGGAPVGRVGISSACAGGANNNDVVNCEETWDHVGEPYLVSYGSTNYGSRSVHRDVEVEVFLYTTNEGLRGALRQDLISLLQESTSVSDERFVGNGEGRFQPLVSLMAQMGQDLL
ncbi:phosphatidylglycerophosphate synthase-like protein, putative [Trypanosoma brucei brucei TREU927]|uniref:CDP-diacylglycerol--glycerol-3-phosphate 3-phosphatidyltransferase n=1 Tax=Trypanosoma brucei brucei (strain 927/4 GUTat10.1) TaxID=185431 RepID=Q582B0_TRYB2|nr:phosphatidylglycerophosphate synthase-like protein, putative [Trypanosoma brucei brucei TREU927]AAX79393.1 phosphatidylglycerophosphate synthase-like protein, putative [Trypanosoma brucei]AAZ12939.1 phosphatidylglycerophosphate synthase-like protein, putative [Trypanosoma brucei brucei TREU927]